ncbi:MAG TPA: hypothetical protein VLT60_03165 [Usitatibacter sp.]|nr:hypothetical protein [Usitatibacter sp.]
MTRPDLRRFFTALVVLGSVLAQVAEAAGEPTRIRIYGAAIEVPDPPGLVPLINKDSHYYRFGARLQAQNRNQLFGYFLPPAEAAVADIDQLPTPSHWGIAYGVGPMLNRTVTVEQFQKEVVPDVQRSVVAAANDPALRRKLGEGTDASVAMLGRELAVDAGKLRMGEITPLGAFDKGERYATFGAATRIRVERGAEVMEAPVITVIGFIVVKERLFCIAVYRMYREEKDIEQARRDADAWAQAIVRANPSGP